MSGKNITHKQKEFYMNLRNQGDTQELAAAKTGISERSAKRIDKLRSNDCPHDKKRGVKKDPIRTSLAIRPCTSFRERTYASGNYTS